MTKIVGFDRAGIAKARVRGERGSSNDAILLTYLPERNQIHLKLRNRTEVMIPVWSIASLRNIEKSALKRMRLSKMGDSIELPEYDRSVSVAGVVRTAIFGEDPFSKAGRVKSRAKSIAARANGRKGGRPKRTLTVA